MNSNEVFNKILSHFDLDDFPVIKTSKGKITFTLEFSEYNLSNIHKLFHLEFNQDVLITTLIFSDFNDGYHYEIKSLGFKDYYDIDIVFELIPE